MPRGVYARPSLKERFESKVDRQHGPVIKKKLGRCHVWTAGKFDDGYGGFAINRKIKKAHRVAWDLAHPEDPVLNDEVVCHRCDNPPCVRASHLFKGRPLNNSEDMVRKGRSFHPRGHLQGAAKLTWEKVSEIRQLGEQTEWSQSKIAREFGISQAQVWRILNNHCWLIETTIP